MTQSTYAQKPNAPGDYALQREETEMVTQRLYRINFNNNRTAQRTTNNLHDALPI